MRFQCAHWQLRFADTAAHAHSSGQRSEIPPKVRLWTGILPRIWVAGHQELLGAPVMVSLSWLQSVSWEVTWGGGVWTPVQLVVCLQGVDTINWLSVFCIWNFSIGHFLFYFVSPTLSCNSHFTFGFWVQSFLFVFQFYRISGWLCVLFPPPPLNSEGPVCFDLLCDLCRVFFVSQPVTHVLQVLLSGEM